MDSLDETRKARCGIGCILFVLGVDAFFLVAKGALGNAPWYVLYPLWTFSQQVSAWDPRVGLALNVLTGYWGRFVLLVLLLGWGLCGLRPRDVGLGRFKGKAATALIATAAMWATAQAIMLIHSLLSGSGPRLSDIWTGSRAATLAASSAKTFLGVAFFEEVFYRGMILPQVFLSLRERFPKGAFIAALFLSQIPFALLHIPHYGMPLPLPVGLFVVWATGVLFALLWLRTGNILVAVGWHGLIDYPLALIKASEQVAVGAAYIAGIVLLVLWPMITSRRGAPRPGISHR